MGSQVRILHTVEFYYPSVGGAQEKVRQVSERLVRLGHDVTVATRRLLTRNSSVLNGVNIEEFNISGNAVQGFSGEVEHYQKFIFESSFDVIMNYAAQQWATDLVLPILNRISAKKVFVPCGFSGLYLPEYGDYFEQMKTWLKQYDVCVYLSNDYRDVNFARKCGTDNGVLIPNGAGADEFDQKADIDIRAQLEIPPEHFLILHVGSHTGAKGHKEAIRIYKKARIRHATFLIVANNFGAGSCTRSCLRKEKLYRCNRLSRVLDKKILVKSLSRKETVAAYHEADLFFFPSNIECSPITLFEAMASKTPFLTTDVGNSKEIIEWSNAGELLPTLKFPNGYVRANVNASVDVLQRFFYNPEKRQRMASDGYKNWKTSFTWEKITKQYENLYIKLLSNNKGRS